MKVLIFAEGRGARWNVSRSAFSMRLNWLPDYKHWLDCGGESVIGRTLRLLGERDITVFAPPAFHEVSKPFPLVTMKGSLLAEIGPLVDGIATSRDHWGQDKTLFLLGDVLFSTKGLDTIMKRAESAQDVFRFYGRRTPNPVTGKTAHELFGFVASSAFYNEVVQTCRKLAIQETREKKPVGNLWKLWDQISISTVFHIDDYSDDTDSPEEYAQFWPALQHAAIHDQVL